MTSRQAYTICHPLLSSVHFHLAMHAGEKEREEELIQNSNFFMKRRELPMPEQLLAAFGC